MSFVFFSLTSRQYSLDFLETKSISLMVNMPCILFVYLQVTAVEELQNSEGIWIRLDAETMSHYCHEGEGEAWSLSRGNDDIAYLKHEGELQVQGKHINISINSCVNTVRLLAEISKFLPRI